MGIEPGVKAEIDYATRQFTTLLDRYVPGLIESLHLVGSAADGDFQPGRSDLDFVAVTSRPASADDLEALVILHRLYGSDQTFPPLDGIWVTPAELASGPDICTDGPTSHGNQFFEQSRGNRNPVTWFSLRDRSVAVQGELDRSVIWADSARLASWTCENVERYWAGWLAGASRLFSGPGLASMGAATPMWGVLGISRLHYTLATGGIASKSEAGSHALTVFDQRWHRIITECLRVRRGGGGSLYRNPFARRREALQFVGMVIETIRERYCASE